MRRFICLAACAASLLAGCATPRQTPAQALRSSAPPAWSIEAKPDHFVVSISPARQTLQLVGSTGLLLGSGISALSNAKHRREMEEALSTFDPGKQIDERIQTALNEALGAQAKRVTPFDGGVNTKARNDAFAERCRVLRQAGHEWVLDLQTTYGIFGIQGRAVAAVEGTLYETKRGRLHWKDKIAVSPDPILASDKPGDPTKPFGFKVSSKLSAEEDAVSRWTTGRGKPLHAAFENATSGIAAALLQDLGLRTSAEGSYWLGQQALQEKDWERAATLFAQALQLEPNMTNAEHGRALAIAASGNPQGAVTLTEKMLAANPEDGVAHYNLAWWYAVKLDGALKAKPHYEAAIAKGLPHCKDIEKRIEKAGR